MSHRLPASTASLPTLYETPAWNVPSPLNSFVGRNDEIQQVCTLLQRPGLRLLTLVGAAGVGKTRLSMHIAQQLRGTFDFGIYFVPLSSIHQANEIGEALAQALHLTIQGERPLLTQITQFLCGKEILLILDNFEHLMDAATEIEKIVCTCPQLKILVTSRSGLHLPGEQEYPLQPLPTPAMATIPTPETLLNYDAVTLFVQRAQAILPTFEMNRQNAQAIAQICSRLDGLPLAIEMAAARVKIFSPSMLLEKLARRFSILTANTHASIQRQQTLWQTLTWSYNLLNEQEQFLFRLLAIFHNGATLEAIEQVITMQENGAGFSVADLIESLLDKSLLTFRDDSTGQRRFYMLETVEAYALERLQELACAEKLRTDYAYYYLALAEQHEILLKGQAQHTSLRQLDQERANFSATLQWFLERGLTEMALRLCGTLFRFSYLRGYWSEARSAMQTVLEYPAPLAPTTAYIRVLLYYGELAFYQHDMQTAHQALSRGLQFSEELNYAREQAYAHYRLSFYYHQQGNVEEARRSLQTGEALCRQYQYSWELAHILRAQGFIAWSLGEHATASSLTHESLNIARNTGDQALIAKVLSLLLVIVTLQGNFEQAVILNQEILDIAQELEDKYLIATALQNLGYLTAQIGANPQSLSLVQQGLALFRELGYTLLVINALHSLGYVAARQGNLQLATDSFREGLTLAIKLADDTQIGWHLIGWADVLTTQQRYQHAAQLLGAAEKRFDINTQMNATEQAEYHRMQHRLQQVLGEYQCTQLMQKGREGTLATFLYELSSERQTGVVTLPCPPSLARDALPLGLTRRELEILRAVAQGQTDADIADTLVISPRTVNWHVSNIYSKLQISSRSAATRIAIEQRLI